MTSYWLSFALFGITAGAGFVYQWGLIGRQARELGSMRKELRTLASNLSAQCGSAVGMNKRLASMEQGLELVQRQSEHQKTELRKAEQPYGEAIHLVHQGAGVRRLMEELGLSRAEAELISRVHGVRAAA